MGGFRVQSLFRHVYVLLGPLMRCRTRAEPCQFPMLISKARSRSNTNANSNTNTII